MVRGIDYIGVGVGAIIFDQKGRIFLAKRGVKSRNEAGKWECPGGALEFGDSFEKTLKREMKEEYGIEIEVKEFLDVCNHIIPEEKQHWVSPSFLCRVRLGEPRILEPQKCSVIGWFTIDEIVKMPITIVTKYNIKSLRKRYSDVLPDFYINEPAQRG